MLIFKKQSNIDSLKISCRLTWPFRLNSFKWKDLYWFECYVNCYVYFDYISLLKSFLILAFKGVTKWWTISYTHYFTFVIILFKRVNVGLYFLPILSNTGFPSFCVFYDFLFWIIRFESGLKTYVLSFINRVLVAL